MTPLRDISREEPRTVPADQLVRRLAGRLDVSPLEATKALGELVRFVRTRVERDGQATVGGLGTFRAANGSLAFEPEDALAAAVNARYAGLHQVAFAGGAAPLAYRKHEVVRSAPQGDSYVPGDAEDTPETGGVSSLDEPELSPLSQPPTLTIHEETPESRGAQEEPPTLSVPAPTPSLPEPPAEAAPTSPRAEPERPETPADAPAPSAAPQVDPETDAFWRELDDLERLLRGPLTATDSVAAPSAVPSEPTPPPSAPAEPRAPQPRHEQRPLDAWLASDTDLPPTSLGWSLIDSADLDDDLRAPEAQPEVAPEPEPEPSEPAPFLPDVPGFDLMDLDEPDEPTAFTPSPFAPPSAPAAETYGFDELGEASWEEERFDEQRVKPLEPEVESAWETDPTERMGPPPALAWPGAEPAAPSLARAAPPKPPEDSYAPPTFEADVLPVPEPAQEPEREPEAASVAEAPAPSWQPPPAALPRSEPEQKPEPAHAEPSEWPALSAPAPPTEPAPRPPQSREEVAPPAEASVPASTPLRRPAPPERRRGGTSGWMLGAVLLIVAAAVALAYVLGPADVSERPDATRNTPPQQQATPRSAPGALPAPTQPDVSGSDAPDAGAPEPGDAEPRAAQPQHTSAASEPAEVPPQPPAAMTPAQRQALRAHEPLALPAAGAEPTYTLVVLSTPDAEEAQDRADRYRALGYRTGVVYGPYRDVVRYRVAVGSFATLSEAAATRDAARDELPSGAWVLPLRSAFDLAEER